jgi:hypothetical protein
MKASRWKHRKPAKRPSSPGERRPVRQPARRGPRPHPALFWMCAISVVIGAVLLVKVGTTLVEGVAWDDLETVTREEQPLAFWMFVATYGVMGGGMTWLGVHLWRTR